MDKQFQRDMERVVNELAIKFGYSVEAARKLGDRAIEEMKKLDLKNLNAASFAEHMEKIVTEALRNDEDWARHFGLESIGRIVEVVAEARMKKQDPTTAVSVALGMSMDKAKDAIEAIKKLLDF